MGTHEILALDSTGHSKTVWDSERPEEVAAAKATYDSLIKKGYSAFRTKKDGSQGKQMDAFDPEAEAMILVPRMAGG